TLSLDVEVAIIDKECKLVISSEKYRYYKGREVHQFSVEEAFKEGRLIISKPGFMESCKGCRFQFKCPSSVELVQPIGQKNDPAGIISVTSFQIIKECEKEDALEKYEKALGYASNLVDFALKTLSGKSSLSFSDSLALPVTIAGKSNSLLDLTEKIKKVSQTSSNVLITGETGTGKELFAKTIHTNGPRVEQAFIPINCAAIPDNLLESELFGYEPGAFTGALKTGKAGLFEQAHMGTLFLDEIGDMPITLQAKILRVLQDKKVRRIGGTGVFNADVRIISATNRNLEAMIEKKAFRLDLFYRIAVVPLHIPPLRERKEDIEVLARFFLDKFVKEMGLKKICFSKETLAVLNAHQWLGNARELENAVEYALNMCEKNTITPQALPDSIQKGKINKMTLPGQKIDPVIGTPFLPYKEAVLNFEKSLFTSTLEQTGSDLEGKKRAAQKLGLGLRTLYRKLEQHQALDV
ncbi:MAG: sigma-54 dependent transcriptional regulator, partial [Proteobacteria bacterium]|nr:sigma-54 dependent transcriptional regulator [Pseudomonadota bacterium]MBU1581945.1 sigma-54 dependent transcriptional regulator [Pseudomonadota bacterium]